MTKVINERELQVEIAEGVRTRVVRQTISEVLSKTEPAQAASEEADDEQEESEEEAEKPKSGRGNRKG